MFRFMHIALSAGLLASTTLTVPSLAQNAASPAPSHAWKHFPVKPEAPEGAPNILVVLTDDVGFGASSTFGGLIPTPNLDRVAQQGLRYTQFHTTAMCSPTRAALLTGRNHHAVNAGAIDDLSLDREGYTSAIPESAATIGTVLGLHGYNTAWIGKNHNTPLWENTPLGPFQRWPNGMGFDYFYGFNGAYTNQYAPSLIENRNQVQPKLDKDYILERDLADHAVDWLRLQQTLGASSPFLLYYAPSTAHAPVQAPRAWIDRFRGQFDEGWDAARERIYNQQLRSGILPKGTRLTPRPSQLPSWNSLTPEQKRFQARLMEAYAGMLAYSDDQFGRIVKELERSGRLNNTLIIFIEGDNGAAPESLSGALNEITVFTQTDTSSEDAQQIDAIGGRDSQPAIPAPWAWALNTPFQWGKQIASHFGGTRNGMVVSWPRRIKAVGQIRQQFHHVIDVAPTIYEAAGVTPDPVISGVNQMAIDGVSMVYSFDAPSAPSHRHSQYFEMLGNRGYYKEGWIGVTTPRRMPWSAEYLSPTYTWELYHVADDFSESKDLAKRRPDKLAELQRDFDRVASENKALPIDDSFLPRFSAQMRPTAFGHQTNFIYYPGQTEYSASAFPALTSNWSATARINIAADGKSAPLIVRGDKFGGWGLFLDRGVPLLIYRVTHVPRHSFQIRGSEALSPGEHELRVSVEREEKGGHRLSLAIDDREIGSQHLERLAFPRIETHIGRQGAIEMVDLPTMPEESADVLKQVDISFPPD
jgi:arylsulfatase A-like enzyme